MTHDVEAQRADELDAAITALLAGGDAAPETPFVAALLRLSAALEPEAAFAANLEAQLLAPSAPEASRTQDGRAPRRSGRRMPGRWWMPLAAMVLLALLLVVPQARAEIQTLIRIGAVRIGLVPQPRATPAPGATPTPTPLPSPLDLAGATTLEQARAQADIPILLPTYPPDLGPPRYVFLQNLDGPMVALVWVDPARPSSVRLALFEMSNSVFVYKSGARVVAQTTVDGQPALWTDGPYIVEVLVNGQVVEDTRRLVTGHALIWTAGGITYRLETDQPLDVAVRIAESLR